jgi:type VI secretion system protein ImpA
MTTEAFLRPVAGAVACGPDLSFSVEFDRLQELRREDDPTIPRGELDAEHKRADWPAVVKLAGELLAEQTKDLRLAAWWTEAAAKIEGYAGLGEGLALYKDLCETFWEEVHPQPEGGDFELRIGSITWLLGLVSGMARHLPVLQAGGQSVSLAEWGNLRQRARGDHEESAKAARDVLDRVQRGAQGPALLAVLEAARGIVATLDRLQTLVDAKLGADGPAFVAAREASQEAVAGIERIATELGFIGSPASHADAPSGSAEADEAASPAHGGAQGAGPPVMPRSRTQALAQLRLVADYFRRHEPHSPVAYLAERAAQWGEMPLHVWLRAVLKEPGALASLDELLGVNPPGSAGDA